MMTPAIETRALSKRYGAKGGPRTVTALDEVSLTVGRGEIFALLGLNGAGKSTFIRIVLDLIRPSSGEAMVLGVAAGSSDWKRQVGYLPELFRAPSGFTVLGLLRYLGHLNGIEGAKLEQRIEVVVMTLGLTETAAQRVDSLSKGTMLRLGIAQAILHDPELIIFDEPTDGLDPAGRRLMRDLLISLKQRGKTVVLN
jgi:ABC-2 type transport system ATP-binding protein